MKRLIVNIQLVCFLVSFSHFLSASPIGEIRWTESFLHAEDQVPTDRLKFGFVTVPEDYDKPEGRLLLIAFVVIKAHQDHSSKDACIYFKGGWGTRTIRDLPYYQGHFLSNKRDLILYDYRGTGYSGPRLCDGLGLDVFNNVLMNISYAEFEERQKITFNHCLDELERQGIDFNQYGSDNKGMDGVILAHSPGYESYNLFGVSYGTKTILQFIRQSKVKIRSVILDSNCPLNFPINSGMTEDYANSLDQILKDCEHDPDCHQKYPKLREKLVSFLHSLEKKPLRIKLPKSRIAYLNKQEVNGIIQQLIYDERSYGIMPFLLKKFSKRNLFVIKRIVRDMEDALMENYNGVGLINYVYDHKPFQEKAKVLSRNSIAKYPAFHVFDGYQAYYVQDKRFRSDLAQTQTLLTDIPTLILAGAYDPVTPTYYSQMLLPYFSNHVYVEFPKTGHGVTDNSCGRNLAEHFLNSFQNPLEHACLQAVRNQRIVFER